MDRSDSAYADLVASEFIASFHSTILSTSINIGAITNLKCTGVQWRFSGFRAQLEDIWIHVVMAPAIFLLIPVAANAAGMTVTSKYPALLTKFCVRWKYRRYVASVLGQQSTQNQLSSKTLKVSNYNYHLFQEWNMSFVFWNYIGTLSEERLYVSPNSLYLEQCQAVISYKDIASLSQRLFQAAAS